MTTAISEYFDRTRERALRNLTRTIQRSYPDHEIYPADSSLREVSSDIAWVIEPISGSLNFMRRSDQFCTLIALLRKGRFEHALVIDHFRDGQYHVTRTEGCFSNAGRMRVSEIRSAPDAVIATDESFSQLDQIQCALRISGSAGLDIVNTASGKLDALVLNHATALEFYLARLFIREAGGFVTAISGGEWDVPEDGLVGGSNYMHRNLLSALNRPEQITKT